MKKATANNIRISPLKMRLAANLAKGKHAQKVCIALDHMDKKSCRLLSKLIKSCIANAKQENYDVDSLFINEVSVGRGTYMKRFMPRAKSAANTITKYSSNVTVWLSGSKKVMIEDKSLLGGEDMESQNG